MLVDTKKRTYKFRINVGTIPFLDCTGISGLESNRGIISYVDVHGDEIPLIGGKKISHLEISDVGATGSDFFAWYNAMNPERLSGSIEVMNQSEEVVETYTYTDMIPESIGPDNLDRKTEETHKVTYKIACSLWKVE